MIAIEGRVLDLVPKPLRVWAAAAVLISQPGCMCGRSAPHRYTAEAPAAGRGVDADRPGPGRAVARGAERES